MSSQLETRSCSFGKPKSLFGFSLPHSPSLLVQSLVHSYSFGEPNTQLGFSLPQCTSLLCSITALPETSQQSEAAPSVNPVLCPDSPFHSLLSLFGVLFAAAPLVNPILCLDSHFHRLLFGQSFCLLSGRLQPHFRRLLFADYPVGRSSSLAPSGLELHFRRLLPTNLSGQLVQYSPQNHV